MIFNVHSENQRRPWRQKSQQEASVQRLAQLTLLFGKDSRGFCGREKQTQNISAAKAPKASAKLHNGVELFRSSEAQAKAEITLVLRPKTCALPIPISIWLVLCTWRTLYYTCSCTCINIDEYWFSRVMLLRLRSCKLVLYLEKTIKNISVPEKGNSLQEPPKLKAFLPKSRQVLSSLEVFVYEKWRNDPPRG